MNTTVNIAAEQEELAFKASAARLRFKQQVLLGVGGAIIFGLVGALATSLLGTAMVGGTFAMAPVLGLGAIAAIGLGCIYLGSRYLTEVISNDQTQQARKICDLSRGKTTELAPAVTHATTLPVTAADLDSPRTTVQADSLQLVSPKHEPHHAQHKTAESWVDRHANDNLSAPLAEAGR